MTQMVHARYEEKNQGIQSQVYRLWRQKRLMKRLV